MLRKLKMLNSEKILQKYLKKNVPDIHTGDTVRVFTRVKEGNKERIQIFEGLVIATRGGKGLDGSFKVRKVNYGVGVERTFPLHSSNIVKVERIKQSRVRRSKLYYIRELSGKAARLKELNRDLVIWEEPEAEKEMEKIQEAVAAEAEARAEEKVEEEVEPGSADDLPANATHQVLQAGERKEESVEEKADKAAGKPVSS